MKILGIETSCDETAAAIVEMDEAGRGHILSNQILSQYKEHKIHGGVVPEIAARSHIEHLDDMIRNALKESGLSFDDIDGVAATCGPGLIGGVMIGMIAGKAIAAARSLPFIAVNHMEAHALTPRLTDNIPFPYLLLLVSGGHTQILVAKDVGDYELWGTTIDDALGECFDKSAKLMGLPHPGGPHLEKAALQCPDPDKALSRFDLPRPMKGRKNCDFSFSGLKTAVRTYVQQLNQSERDDLFTLDKNDVYDLAFAFEDAVCDTVCDRVKRAIAYFKTRYAKDIKGRPALVVSGGVAANKKLRASLNHLTEKHDMALMASPIELCGDNAAMVAWAGAEKLVRGESSPLDIKARPRWPLDPDAQAHREQFGN